MPFRHIPERDARECWATLAYGGADVTIFEKQTRANGASGRGKERKIGSP